MSSLKALQTLYANFYISFFILYNFSASLDSLFVCNILINFFFLFSTSLFIYKLTAKFPSYYSNEGIWRITSLKERFLNHQDYFQNYMSCKYRHSKNIPNIIIFSFVCFVIIFLVEITSLMKCFVNRYLQNNNLDTRIPTTLQNRKDMDIL